MHDLPTAVCCTNNRHILHWTRRATQKKTIIKYQPICFSAVISDQIMSRFVFRWSTTFYWIRKGFGYRIACELVFIETRVQSTVSESPGTCAPLLNALRQKTLGVSVRKKWRLCHRQRLVTLRLGAFKRLTVTVTPLKQICYHRVITKDYITKSMYLDLTKNVCNQKPLIKINSICKI